MDLMFTRFGKGSNIKNLSFNNLKIGISCIIFVIMFNHKRMEAIWQKYSRGKYLIHFGPEWSH